MCIIIISMFTHGAGCIAATIKGGVSALPSTPGVNAGDSSGGSGEESSNAE